MRSMRQEWRMHFASSGAAALEIMENEAFDVIVTDMRMPGMSGAQLLTEVLKSYPHVVRIMLSGHSDLQAIMQSVGPTHQYLTKPCDADVLKKTIASACALRDLLSSPALRSMVAEMKSLPSLPALYVEMMEVVQTNDMPLTAIGNVISRDAGMTAKMLQLVNSAFFGSPRRMTNVVEAITMLGLDTVRALVLTFNVFEQCNTPMLPGFSSEALWQHSLMVGKLAKQIAVAEGSDRRLCEDAYTAGLLHDAGKLALVVHLPIPYAEALTVAQKEKIPLVEAETIVLGATHAEVGAYLMGLWGLPAAIVEALAFHHRPEICQESQFGPLTAVYAANHLVNAACPGADIGVSTPVNSDYFSALQLTGSMECWQGIYRKMLDDE